MGIAAFAFVIVILQTLVSRTSSKEKVNSLVPTANSPINTSSGVSGSQQCTKNSDESYAVCASKSNTAIKYNLQPFSVAAKGPNQGKYMISCDLFETSSQSTSLAICAKGSTSASANGVVYFHTVSDMINITNVTIGTSGLEPHVIVDTPNQVAYISNYDTAPTIYKITNIGGTTPIVAATVSSFGSGDQYPAAMLIVDGFLYFHMWMYPARLARINITTFTWAQTVDFASTEGYGNYDNLANDDNFIYDLTYDGIIVRCTYKNNTFARVGSLPTGSSDTDSLTISPDHRTLFLVSEANSVLQLVDVVSFTTFGNTGTVPSASGRPIVTSTQFVYAFSGTGDVVYAYQYTNPTKTRSASSELTLSASTACSNPTNTRSRIVDHAPDTFTASSSPSTVSSSPSFPPSQTETAEQVSITGLETRTVSAVAAVPSATPKIPGESVEIRSSTRTKILPETNGLIEKISQPVASALVASDATQAIAVVSVAVLGSISSSPVLGFNVGRQQAMTNFAKKSLEGDCRGLLPATTVNEFEQHISNPLGLGDSPTQMSIGGSEKLMSYYVGAVVGDFILTFGLVLLSQGIGMGVMKYFENKKNNNSNFGKLVRDRMGNKNNNNSSKESTFEMVRRVFATSYVSLTLFFCLSFLLTPILSSSLIVLVAAMNDPKLKDHEVGVGLKILCVILAVIFCAVAVYFVVWSVFVRKQRKEKYRILKQDNKKSQNQEKNIGAYLFKAEGEWCYPNPSSSSQQNLVDLMNRSKKNNNKSYHRQFTLWNHNFLISEPTFESYRDTIWFCCVEIISAILLAFPPFFAQFSSSAKGSCLIQGIMLLLILLVYFILLLWKNPFKLRILRIMNPALALQQLAVVLISLIIAASRNDNNDDGESPSWLWKVIIIPLGFQGAMSFLMIGAAFFPFVLFLRQLKRRMSRREVHNDERPKNNNLSADRARSLRTTSRRHNDANEIELLPRRSSARQRISSEHDHRERHLHHDDNRGRESRNQHPRSSNRVEMSPRVNREKPSSSAVRDPREGHRQTNSRGTELDGSSSAIRRNNNHHHDNITRGNENSNYHHDHRRRHEMQTSFVFAERDERRTSRSLK